MKTNEIVQGKQEAREAYMNGKERELFEAGKNTWRLLVLGHRGGGHKGLQGECPACFPVDLP